MNNFTFSGILTQKPELRYTSIDQTPVCTSYTEFVERTKDQGKATIKVVAWGKQTDAFHSLQEGTQVLLEGSLRMNKVATDAGSRTVPELNIGRFEIIGNQAKVTKADQKTVDAEATEFEDEEFPFN